MNNHPEQHPQQLKEWQVTSSIWLWWCLTSLAESSFWATMDTGIPQQFAALFTEKNWKYHVILTDVLSIQLNLRPLWKILKSNLPRSTSQILTLHSFHSLPRLNIRSTRGVLAMASANKTFGSVFTVMVAKMRAVTCKVGQCSCLWQKSMEFTSKCWISLLQCLLIVCNHLKAR